MQNGWWWDRVGIPVGGCSHASPGCMNCYAQQIAGTYTWPCSSSSSPPSFRSFRARDGLSRGPQTWAWLYGVNVYIAIQGDWSFSYLEHLSSLSVEEHFYLVWPFVVFLLASRPRTLIAVSLAIALGAMLARLTGSLIGVSWWTTYVLTPFRLDGLALGAFLAMTMRRPGGSEQLVRALPRVGPAALCCSARTSGPSSVP